MVVASKDQKMANAVQQLLASRNLRISTSRYFLHPDPVINDLIMNLGCRSFSNNLVKAVVLSFWNIHGQIYLT